ncbi:30S ribosome-binding factor RbfA [Candidatus Similichlamydia laticola]|uniref:Ribosome-binding factor A n=1 Tax=Candidatus Similichlamydia laticola TaxID=2170265 RepID=A0A369KI34_9BACT|nr:30S ribosome-binding factor RbfA [Candidatus Similichlamydia laticola]RDB31453.1 Ribosome-binding factor A [Candidatus Similichlamydia laticola]
MRRRKARLDSLLREVIGEVIRDRVADPRVSSFLTITEVDVSPDLRRARVGVSILGSQEEREVTLRTLQNMSKFVGTEAARLVTLRYFPSLQFFSDRRIEEAARLEELLRQANYTG